MHPCDTCDTCDTGATKERGFVWAHARRYPVNIPGGGKIQLMRTAISVPFIRKLALFDRQLRS